MTQNKAAAAACHERDDFSDGTLKINITETFNRTHC